MSTLAQATLKTTAILAPGTYSGKISNIGDKETTKFGPAVKVYFKIDKELTGEGWEDLEDAVELSRLVSVGGMASPKTILYQLASAAWGRDLEEGEGIDTDDLLDKRLQVTVDVEKDGDKAYARIKTFAPWKTKKQQPVTTNGNGAAKRQAPDLD